MNTAIEFKDLCGGYETNQLFKGISAVIEQGSFTSIIGPNGAGKSTLLKFLVKELKAKDQTVFVMGSDLRQLSQKMLARNLAMVPQHASQEYEFTVTDVVAMGRYAHLGRFESFKEADSQMVATSLELTGLSSLKDKLATQLSGGETQRMILARALCQEPDVLILDEPINHLDPKHQKDIMRLLRSLVDDRKLTVICVLHALDVVQLFSDHVLLMDKGSIIAQGQVQEVLTEERIRSVYQVEVHQYEDPVTGRTILLPCW